MIEKVEKFILDIKDLNPPTQNSLNIYKGDSMAAVQRRRDLRKYLRKMQEINPTKLFVGEAPGHKGCFISGVPFTDEYTIMKNNFFEGLDYCMSDIPDFIPEKESTAQVVWKCLNKIPIKEYPLMWNIFPFHPSTVDSTVVISSLRPNRTPSKKECEYGLKILQNLLEYFNIKEVYAVGKTAERVLKPLFPNVRYVRHPSHGGASLFCKEFDCIYNIC